jgi:DNA polymerase-3 subunit delta'
MTFSGIVGHDRLKDFFLRAQRRGRTPPALVLCGPVGIGKRTLALEAARALLCETKSGDACGACKACDRVARRMHPDFFLLEPAPASIKIEAVRDLVGEVQSRPFEAATRAFVIDDAHLMTEQAQNAFLKSLEEPPATSRILLVTAEPDRLLPTIRSRCQTLRASALTSEQVEAFLSERGVAADEARLRASVSAGSIGRALSFDTDGYMDARESALAAVEAAGSSPFAAMAAADSLADNDAPLVALVAMRSLLRDVAALHAGAAADMLVNSDLEGRLRALAQGRLGAIAIALAEAAERTRLDVRGNTYKPLSFESLLDVMRA